MMRGPWTFSQPVIGPAGEGRSAGIGNPAGRVSGVTVMSLLGGRLAPL